jgi:SAM-dependent methyltransferase
VREHDIRPQALLDEYFARLSRDATRLAAAHAGFVRVACPTCGDARYEIAFVKEGFTYCLCPACASLFVSPRPTAEALAEHVKTSEAVEFWSTHFYRQTADARREQMFRPRAALIAGLVREAGFSAPPSCADVGAGYGLFLQELAATGACGRLDAVEPDARLAAICRGHGFAVVEKWVEEIADGEVSVDFATAFEVIEHVFDPVAFLSACRRLLRPGGLLFFSTLAISGFDLQVLWEHSRSITPPQHLNLPAAGAIARLAERAGLELVRVMTPGQLDVDIVRNRLATHPELPVPRFARAIAEAEDGTRADFQRFLQAHRLSSHLQCLARRPA